MSLNTMSLNTLYHSLCSEYYGKLHEKYDIELDEKYFNITISRKNDFDTYIEICAIGNSFIVNFCVMLSGLYSQFDKKVKLDNTEEIRAFILYNL